MRSASPVFFDTLESRQLMSVAAPISTSAVAHPATTVAATIAPKTPSAVAVASNYNLMNLLGYNRRGSTWTYNNSYSFDNNGINNYTDNKITTVAVGKNAAVVNGKIGNYVYTTGANSLSATYGTDATGMTLLSQNAVSPGSSLGLKFSGVRVAPSVVTIGNVYSDTGTFSGNFVVTIAGKQYTGTAAGTAVTRTRVVRNGAAYTPAGSFYSTIEADFNLTLTGIVTVNVNGQKLAYSFHSTTYNTFYTVPGIGIVKSNFSNVNNYTSPVLPAVRTSLNSSMNLRAYHLV